MFSLEERVLEYTFSLQDGYGDTLGGAVNWVQTNNAPEALRIWGGTCTVVVRRPLSGAAIGEGLISPLSRAKCAVAQRVYRMCTVVEKVKMVESFTFANFVSPYNTTKIR